jgi:hypothetical protein
MKNKPKGWRKCKPFAKRQKLCVNKGMKPHILGIDPGTNGALVLIDLHGDVINHFFMPLIYKKVSTKKHEIGYLDLKTLNQILKEIAKGIECAFLEYVSARPGEGTSSSFKFGGMFWAVQALLVANEIPFKLVHPRVWCECMHEGIKNQPEAKKRSQIAFKNLFPGVDFKRTQRCAENHDGLVDAALIGEYGRRTLAQMDLFVDTK